MSQDARADQELVAQRRAVVLGFDYVDTSKLQKQLYKSILNVAELYRLRVVPIFADEHHIHFGITTTTAQQTIKKLEARFPDQKTTFSVISEAGYRDYMLLYDPPKKVHYRDIALSKSGTTEQAKIVDAVSTTLQQVRPDDTLAYLVKQAYSLKASDIHLECQLENVRVRFRVDGVLHPVAFMAHEKYHHLIAVVASAANISTDADDAQSGHISRSYQMATGEKVTLNLRVETVPTIYGMDIVMRLFNLRLEFFNLQNLGLSPQELGVVDDIIQHPSGMVLVVGPTGSGKTTTLYSLINTLNGPERKIVTLEDPVEYNMPGVVQIPVVGHLEGKNFAEKLRAVLRLDPDVVMVGEIRDQDTAKTALQSALTGHLVLSSFHAASAAAALTRMLDLVGINPLFTSAMRLVMAQRLVRRLDEATRQPYRPDDALKRQLKTVIDTLPADIKRPDINQITLYKAGTSDQNPFGYQGQLALREQLIMTPGVQAILKLPPNQVTTDMLQAKAVEEGMRTILQDGLLKAFDGLTTLEEVYRVVG
ncbi:Flp pilus assembly complex ATPase component TadA [Candidatus Saccharibacteria bacterium]|nr:Flp pilus assembly complex ATPase component TadA [Candidatus Saccharibacteria bacterium]